MRTDDIVKRIDELIEEGNQVLKTRCTRNSTYYVDSGAMIGFRAGSLSFIERIYGCKYSYSSEFDKNTLRFSPSDAERGIGILKAIRNEILGGWLFTVKSLITAEIFADFIEMGNHLLANGYKDPAAVMAGSVLEEHLRHLSLKHGLEVDENNEGQYCSQKS